MPLRTYKIIHYEIGGKFNQIGKTSMKKLELVVLTHFLQHYPVPSRITSVKMTITGPKLPLCPNPYRDTGTNTTLSPISAKLTTLPNSIFFQNPLHWKTKPDM